VLHVEAHVQFEAKFAIANQCQYLLGIRILSDRRKFTCFKLWFAKGGFADVQYGT